MTLDLRGRKIGRLTVLNETEERIGKSIVWLCICKCGKEAKLSARDLLNGNRKGCGNCADTDHYLYGTWRSMISRCISPTNTSWKDYGERGIEVCKRWREDFLNFVEDMGERPLNYSLDRIDVNGNYCKENCRWADAQEQSTNTRACLRKLSIGDLVPIWMSIESNTTLAIKYGVSTKTIANIKSGHYRRPLLLKLLKEIGIKL